MIDAFPDWTKDAACRGKPDGWFHPEEGGRKGVRPPISRRALALCATCPVFDECLAHVLTDEAIEFTLPIMGRAPEEIHHWREGIIAGTDEVDRRDTRHMAPGARFIELKARARTRALQLGLLRKGEVA